MIPIAEYKCLKHIEVNGQTHSLVTTKQPLEGFRPIMAGFRVPGELEIGQMYLLALLPAEGSGQVDD